MKRQNQKKIKEINSKLKEPSYFLNCSQVSKNRYVFEIENKGKTIPNIQSLAKEHKKRNENNDKQFQNYSKNQKYENEKLKFYFKFEQTQSIQNNNSQSIEQLSTQKDVSNSKIDDLLNDINKFKAIKKVKKFNNNLETIEEESK